MERVILVRYGEIGIKSYWVRREFEKIFADNIARALIENKINIEKIEQIGGRTYVWCDNVKKALKILKNVFGIVSYSPAYVIKTDIEEMKKIALKIYKKYGGKFRITTKRRYKKFHMNSIEISSNIGDYIVKKTGAKVDLKNYDINISFEVEKERTFVFYEKYKGWGGLPIGTQGKVVCYVSKEKETWKNVFLMARRGCEIVLACIDGKEFVKKFEKKYYFKEKPHFYKINSLKDIIKIAKSEGAKAIALPSSKIGKFKNDFLILYPSLGFGKNFKQLDFKKFYE